MNSQIDSLFDFNSKGLLSDKGLKKALKKLRKKNKTIPSLSPSLGLRPHN